MEFSCFFGHKIHISHDVELKIAENMSFDNTYRKNLSVDLYNMPFYTMNVEQECSIYFNKLLYKFKFEANDIN